MKIIIADGVKLPEMEKKGEVACKWNVYARAIVYDEIDDRTGLYKDICNFSSIFAPDSPQSQIQSEPLGGLRYLLKHGEIVPIGLGIQFDFGSHFWYHGLISMRRFGLFKKLEVVNANNPIDSNSTGEIVAFVRNNGDSQFIGARIPFLQIHFQDSMRFPDVEILRKKNFSS